MTAPYTFRDGCQKLQNTAMKISKTLAIPVFIVCILFYPILSFIWYKATGYWKFALWGCIGTLGISGVIVLCFIPIQDRVISLMVTLVFDLLYVLPSPFQFREMFRLKQKNG